MNSTARFEYVRHKYLIKLIPWFALYVVSYELSYDISYFSKNDHEIPPYFTTEEKTCWQEYTSNLSMAKRPKSTRKRLV